MKKCRAVIVSLLAALGMAAPALAADMAVKAPPPAPPIPIYSWSGFYIGLNGGWADSHNCWDFVTVAGVAVPGGCGDRSGGVAGGQVGYRWQANQFVFGLEAQGDWADISNSRISLINPAFTTRVRTDGIGLFTGQIGWTGWNPAALLYVKGGAAVTSTSLDIFTAGVDVASANATRWGGTVGVGFEYGFASNWSVGVEYDHLFMGNANNSFSVVNPVVAGAINRISEDIDMVTLRVNYHFNAWGAPPVTARY